MLRMLFVAAVLCLLTAPAAAQASGHGDISPQEAEMSPMVVPDG